MDLDFDLFFTCKILCFIAVDPIEDEYWEYGRMPDFGNLSRLIYEELNPLLSRDLWRDFDDQLHNTFLRFLWGYYQLCYSPFFEWEP